MLANRQRDVKKRERKKEERGAKRERGRGQGKGKWKGKSTYKESTNSRKFSCHSIPLCVVCLYVLTAKQSKHWKDVKLFSSSIANDINNSKKRESDLSSLYHWISWIIMWFFGHTRNKQSVIIEGTIRQRYLCTRCVYVCRYMCYICML